MIHEKNSTRWKLGDYVIHDADAKNERMLMIVTGCTKEGTYITRYANKDVCPDRYENPLKVLHDPLRFGIETPNAEVWGRRSAASSGPTRPPGSTAETGDKT